MKLPKNDKAMNYFMLESVQEDLLVKGENTYIYGNQLGQWIQLPMTKTAWTFKVNYCKNINIKNIPRKIVDAFEKSACMQHKFEGGYEEAISVLVIK